VRAVPFVLGEVGPHQTQSRLGRGLPPYQVCSHLATTDMCRKLGVPPLLWGGGAESLSNTMWPGPRPTCTPSFILIIQPFGHNTPTLHTYRQTDRQTDRQWSDSTWQTILQTVSPKSRLVQPFQCQLMQAVLAKRSLNRCPSVCLLLRMQHQNYIINVDIFHHITKYFPELPLPLPLPPLPLPLSLLPYLYIICSSGSIIFWALVLT